MADQSSEKTLDSTSSLSDQPQPSQSPATDPISGADPPLTRNLSSSKLNAKAPEFVPKKPAATAAPIMAPPPPPPPPAAAMVHVYPNAPFPVPIQGHLPPHMHHPHPHHVHHPQYHHHHHQNQNHHHHQNHNKNKQQQHEQEREAVEQDKQQGNGGASKNGLSDEATQKLINQVEYYFSDVNLATTDHLIKFINKDSEGFVPISVVASFKKIKALISSNSQLAAVLRNSTKLVVSEDGKKVKRLHPLTSSDMEELQARIIVAENLPEDHCHQNLMKIFSAVGSVKSIRTCIPQHSNNGASSASRSSKTDNMHYSNKLHAFVEYESVELAEKALAELNDEDDWRNGLRIRLLHKRGSKPAQARAKKSGNDGEVTCEEEDASTSEQNQNEKQAEEPSVQSDVQSLEHGEEQLVEKEGGQRRNRNRNRGKGRGRGQHQHHQNNRGNHVGGPPNAANGEQPAIIKQQPPGPRMPDGTRGFSMGRGRPLTVNTAA